MIRTMFGPTSAQTPPHDALALVRPLQKPYHQQAMNLLVSYSPKRLGFF